MHPIRTGILPSERVSEIYWSTSEERILRQHYPAGGSRACAPLLPRRSKRSIGKRAHLLGLKRIAR